jgi:hypothetical protein
MNGAHPLIGVQLGAHSVFDEGVAHCLDLLQETAAVNTLLVYSHTYQQFTRGRSRSALADHGKPIPDPQRYLPYTWVQPDETYYANTFLRHVVGQGDVTYAGRDVLATLIPAAQARGMQVYARTLEGSGHDLAEQIPNWVKVTTVDVYGRVHHLPCWNNPAYRGWWLATVEDLFKQYPLDGFQFGSERVGPLSNVLFKGQVPVCFCEHCRGRGHGAGIDVGRAREGFRTLYEFVIDTLSAPADGVIIQILRLLFKYPEILAWARLWRESREDVARMIYGAIKAIKPEAAVGLHIDHQQSTWDPLFRAEMGYDEMVAYCDFIKPILYHDIAGPRVRRWYLERIHGTIAREVSLDALLDLFYAVRGYHSDQEPALDEMDTRGFSPQYVQRETARCKQAVGERAAVYPGIGIDVPWNGQHFKSDPATARAAVLAAFDAGADGIVISREYDEMRVENLRAIGEAVRQITRGGEQ